MDIKYVSTVELQSLEHLWDNEKCSRRVVQAN